MSLPPLPWSYSTNAPINAHEGSGFVYILDANGRKIGTVWGKPDEKMAIVKLIMDASDMMLALENKITKGVPPLAHLPQVPKRGKWDYPGDQCPPYSVDD